MSNKIWNQDQVRHFFNMLLPEEAEVNLDEWEPTSTNGIAWASYTFPSGDDIVINLDFGRLPSIQDKGETVLSFEATVSVWVDHDAPLTSRVVSYCDEMTNVDRVAILLLSQCEHLRECTLGSYLDHLEEVYGVNL